MPQAGISFSVKGDKECILYLNGVKTKVNLESDALMREISNGIAKRAKAWVNLKAYRHPKRQLSSSISVEPVVKASNNEKKQSVVAKASYAYAVETGKRQNGVYDYPVRNFMANAAINTEKNLVPKLLVKYGSKMIAK